MADTTFIAKITKITADWLNDVNDTVYGTKTGQLPVWRTIPVQNWDTGEVISFSLSDYVVSPDGSALTFTYLSGSLPTSLTADSAGEITGTIDSDQGGTYEIVYNATNDSGSVAQVLPSIVVGLEVTAPVWATGGSAIPDFNTQEVGGAFSLDLSAFITDDGDPAKVSAITYAYTATNGLPTGLTFNTVTGLISGITTLEATVSVITVTAVNESGLSADDDFEITIIALEPASETPLMAAFYSGQLACGGAIAPTWGTETNFFVSIGQEVSIDMVTNFIASDGGSAITDVDPAGGSDALPTGLTLDTDGLGGEGIGFITGTVAGAAGTFDLSFTATNGVDTSDDSGVFVMTVIDPDDVTPTLDRIDAVEVASNLFNYIHFNFSEPVGTATDFTSGVVITVNGAERSILVVDDFNTARWRFRVDGARLTGSNIINVVLTDLECGFQSAATLNPVDDADVSYVIPVPPSAGVILSDNFDSGDLSSPTTNSSSVVWFGSNNTSVSDDIAHSGSYSLKFAYPAGSGQGYAEQRFDLGAYYPEIWIQFWYYLTDGTEGLGARYEQIDVPGTDNNKIWRMWGSVDRRNYIPGDTCRAGASAWPTITVGDSKLQLDVKYYDIDSCFVQTRGLGPIPQGQNGTFCNSSTRGVWQRCKYHWKANTINNNDGIFEFWLNDSLQISHKDLPFGLNQNCAVNGMGAGYLMGWNNAKFTEATNIYYDDVVISTEDI